jgi:hypothetical protein
MESGTMGKAKKHIGIRIEDANLHFKLHYIARYEGRSANGQILYLIRKCIEEFEAEYGAIQTPRKPQSAQAPMLHKLQRWED